MKLEQGKAYRVRLTSGKWVAAEFLEEQTTGGFKVATGLNRWMEPAARHVRMSRRFHFRNLQTGRTITLRSMRKVKQIEGGAL